MIITKIIENWKEFKRSDLRRSVRPYFKGDRSKFFSYRSGAETYLKIYHKTFLLEFWLEFEQIVVSINGIDARESPFLTIEARNELKKLSLSKELSVSERNKQIAQLLSKNL